MARVVMMYRTPKDTAAFDAHYFDTHVPLAKLLPGLRKYEIVQGGFDNPDLHLMATFHFDDADAAESALASPQGRAAEADRRLMARDDEVVMFLVDGCEFGSSDLVPM
ncbi:MAG TPA: EthD family reductase [Bryobacteraceae bacterium]|nr:EthD family reductase [Bryobacteraceae bacterium]